MNKRIIFSVAVCVLLLSVAAIVFPGETESSRDIRVWAAASMQIVLEDITRDFSAETGVAVIVCFASSGVLARQIAEGAEADIYISASRDWSDYIVNKIPVVHSDRFAGNHLVLIAPVNSVRMSEDIEICTDENGVITEFHIAAVPGLRLAMGDPDYVPGGAYAAMSLEYFGELEGLSGIIVKTQNVIEARRLVENEEADLGIVFKSDVHACPGIRVLGVFPVESRAEIGYYACLLSESPDASRFYRFLNSSDSARSAFIANGFIFSSSETMEGLDGD